MSKYIDGFVLPVPKKNVTAYRRMDMIKAGKMPFDVKRMSCGGFKVLVDL